MTPPLKRGTGTVKRGRGEEWRKEGGRGPIDVGAVQVAPLIAPQRVQLCGPSAITAHSVRHLTPPVPPPPRSCRLNPLHPSSSSSSPPPPPGFPVLKPTNQPDFVPYPRDISPGWTGAIVSFYLNAPRERVDVHRPTWMQSAEPMRFNSLPCRRRDAAKKSVNERLWALPRSGWKACRAENWAVHTVWSGNYRAFFRMRIPRAICSRFFHEKSFIAIRIISSFQKFKVQVKL